MSQEQQSLEPLLAAQACLQHAPFAIFGLDGNARIIEVNDQACVHLGYSRIELLDLTIFDIDPNFTPEMWHARRRKPFVQGSRRFESQHRRKDGTIFPVEITIIRFELDGKEFSYSFAQDIRDRKNAEEALKQSENRFRTLADASFDGIALTKQGVFLDVNDQFASMFGYSRAELVNTPVIQCVAEEDRKLVTDFMQSGRLEPYQHRAQRKDGTKFLVEVHARTTRIDNQDVRVTTIQDITERKHAEEILHKLDRQNQEALRIAQMCYWEYDVATDMFTLNDQFYTLHGTTAAEAGGYQVSGHDFTRKYLPIEDVHLLETSNKRATETQDPNFQYQFEAHLRRADGSLRNVLVWYYVEKDAQNRTVRLYGVIQDITERQQLKNETEQRRLFLENILTSAPDAIVISDIRHTILEWNAGAEALFGYSSEEACGHKIDELVTGSDPQIYNEATTWTSRVEKRERIPPTETVRYQKDGSPVNVLISVAPLLAANEWGGVVAVYTDVTERIRAEEMLRASEERLRLALEGTLDGIWDWNIQSGVTYFSPRYYTMLGYAPDEFRASYNNWRKLLHPADREATEKVIWQAVEDKTAYTCEYRLKAKNGEWRWVLDRGKVVEVDATGQAIRMAGSQTDITDRKRAEQLLQTLNSAALSMQKALTPKQIFTAVSTELKKIGFSCAIFAIDTTKQYLTPVHLTFKSQYIQAAEKLTGLSAYNFKIPIASVDSFRQTIAERKTVFLQTLKEATRQVLPERITGLADLVMDYLKIKQSIIAPLIADNEVIGLFSVQSDNLRDTDLPTITAFAYQMAAAWRQSQLFEQAQQELTARREAEAQVRRLNEELENRVVERTAQLQAANNELEAFTYSVSHDLRAPLRAIDGYSQILTEDYATALDEEGKQVCAVISTEAQRLGQLIDDLLALSRLGRAEMQLFTVDMTALVKSVYRNIMVSERAESIQFHLAHLPEAQADPILIQQVWTNLLANAIKFSRHQPATVIEVGSTQDEKEITYWVRDNGAGFDMRYADKLFKVFHRLHSQNDFEGTGVGLAIVQRVIQRHGGRVWGAGDIGRGATFYFTLPQKGKNHGPL